MSKRNSKRGHEARGSGQQAPMFSRRMLVVPTLVATVAASLGVNCLMNQQDSLEMKLNLERGYNVGEPAENEWVLLEQTKIQLNLTDPEINLQRQRARNDLEKQGFSPIRLDYKGASETMAVAFEPDVNYARRAAEGIKDSIQHALHFWETERLAKPNIEYVVPKSLDELVAKLDAVTEKNILIFLLRATAGARTYEFSFLSRDAPEQKAVADERVPYPASQFLKRGKGTIAGGHFGITSQKSSPIFVSLNNIPYLILVAPPSNVLMHQLSPQTYRYVEREVEKNGTTQMSITSTLDKWLKREEHFANAVHGLWIPEYDKYKGLGLSETLDVTSSNQFVRALIKRLKTLDKAPSAAAKKGIDLYIDSPERLFTGTGL